MARIPNPREMRRVLPQAVAGPRVSAADLGGDQGLGVVSNVLTGTALKIKRDEDIQAEKDRIETEKLEDYEAEIAYQRLAGELDKNQRSASEEMQAGAAGFTKGQEEFFDTRQQTFLQALPERVRKKYETRLAAGRNSYVAAADNIERRERLRFADETLQARLGELETDLAEDTTGYNGFLNAGLKAIDLSPLPDRLKAGAKREWRDRMARRRELARVSSDPEYARMYTTPGRKGIVDGLVSGAKSAGIDPGFILALVDWETAGTFDPKKQPIGKDGKPLSSAKGLGQFLDGTWEFMGGGDRDDPAEQIRILMKFTAQNKRKAESILGRPPEPAELYAMHMLGAGNGPRLLRADPYEPLSGVLSGWANIRKANNLPANMTASQYLAKYAKSLEERRGKFSGVLQGGTDGASARTIDAVTSEAERTIALDEREAEAAAREQERAKNAALKEIEAAAKQAERDHKAAVTERAEDIIAATQAGNIGDIPLLTDDQIEMLSPERQDIYRRELAAGDARAAVENAPIEDVQTVLEGLRPEGEGFEQEQFAYQEARDVAEKRIIGAQADNHIAMSVGAGRPVNTGFPGVSERMDGLFEAAMGEGGKASEVIVPFVEKYGTIPDAGAEGLSAMMRSKDETDRIEAVKTVRYIEITDEEALRDLPAPMVKRALAINHHLNRGLDWDEASKLTEKQLGDSTADKSRRSINRRLLKDIDVEDDIDDIIDGASLGGAAMGELQQLYEDHFIAFGDRNLTLSITKDAFKRVYGKTGIGPRTELQRDAPEQVYGLYGSDADTEWMQDQLDATLAAQGIEAEGVFLEPVRTTGMPQYEIRGWVDGVFKNLSAEGLGLWTPDQGKEIDANRIRQEEGFNEARYVDLLNERTQLRVIVRGELASMRTGTAVKTHQDFLANPEVFKRRLAAVEAEMDGMREGRVQAMVRAEEERLKRIEEAADPMLRQVGPTFR